MKSKPEHKPKIEDANLDSFKFAKEKQGLYEGINMNAGTKKPRLTNR